MDELDYDIQAKLTNIMKDRQIQLTELKQFFDKKNEKFYKEIIKINLSRIDELIPKLELKKKAENFLSLSTSLGKIIDLDNPFKSILLALKIFEEHKQFINQKVITKSFVYKMFEDSGACPLSKNEYYKKQNFKSPAKEFYKSLYEESGNIFIDFNSYLCFQTDKKQKPTNSKVKVNQFSDNMYKLFSGSTVNYYKLYKRCYTVIFLIRILT